MHRRHFKLVLYLSLIMIPISTQTGSDCLLSDNWAIKRTILRMENRLREIEQEKKFYLKKRNLILTVMEIRRRGEL
jgi:hypothetical protein